MKWLLQDAEALIKKSGLSLDPRWVVAQAKVNFGSNVFSGLTPQQLNGVLSEAIEMAVSDTNEVNEQLAQSYGL